MLGSVVGARDAVHEAMPCACKGAAASAATTSGPSTSSCGAACTAPESRCPRAPRRRRERQFGGVVVPADVAEHHVREAGVRDGAQDGGRAAVAQVAVLAAHARLAVGRVRAGAQHVLVVVALQHHGVRPAEQRDERVGGAAEVGGVADAHRRPVRQVAPAGPLGPGPAAPGDSAPLPAAPVHSARNAAASSTSCGTGVVCTRHGPASNGRPGANGRTPISRSARHRHTVPNAAHTRQP
jgi:hypothetical protein